MKVPNVFKEQDGSFTINVKGQSKVTYKEKEMTEFIPFYGIYEENEMNDKLAISPKSTFKYSSGADVQKVWKAYGWVPPSQVRNDFLFKANRLASGLNK